MQGSLISADAKETNQYIGRFAPSPTGPLHFGSLIAAVGSYLDARAHGGQWRVRLEDIDEPRCSQTDADRILRALEAHGFEWDGEVVYQRLRKPLYADALERLIEQDLAYPCGCSRKEISDSSLQGIEGPVYPGTCREGLKGKPARAWRVRVDEAPICFDDRYQGRHCQRLLTDIGDFVIKRADGFYAYQLAVVVDDIDQAVTHVVRGADLLASTPRQVHLLNVLEATVPQYLHLPVALNESGQKLSKQTRAPELEERQAPLNLWQAMDFLGLQPEPGLRCASARELLAWGMENWRPSCERRLLSSRMNP